jgi:hypothetical protein
MSPREDNLEAQYLMLAIAIETLASFANAYAKRNSTNIPNRVRREKEEEVLNISRKMKIKVSDQFMQEMLRIGGYNDVRLKEIC